MPTYDYSCKTCGKQFEHVQSMRDDSLTECLCGKKGRVERMITSTAGIHFKGSGFYVTDYKKDSPKPSGAAAAETKTETPAASPAVVTPPSSSSTPS